MHEEDEEEPSEQSDNVDKDSSTDTGIPNESSVDTATHTQESTASGEIIVEQSVANVLRPDLSEIRKENNRDTMSYLKSKRINRHKSNDVMDAKKFKPSD